MPGKSKIIIRQSRNNQKYVVVKSPNNKVLATTETYKRIDGAKNVARALKKVIKNAIVVDETAKK